MSAEPPTLEVERLSIEIAGADGPVRLVDDVSFRADRGEVLGVAGESGSGKTMSMLALLGLLPDQCSVAGSARFEGRDVLKLRRAELRALRGREVAMVFQDPMTSLHPMLTVERQLTDHVRFHLRLSRGEARSHAVELLRQVHIPDPEGALRSYPHHFSGGMRQRIAIAIALACKPKLLIADEPTTALDVTVQAGILRLLHELRASRDMTVVLITHDLGVLSALADRLVVFYAGRVVESGPTVPLLGAPRHPYTRGLLESLPQRDRARRQPLQPIEGAPATPARRPPGCAFHPRCSFAGESCRHEVPELTAVGAGRFSACPVDPFAA